MTFSDFMLGVPSGVRLLMVVVLVVGAAMLGLKLFYPRIIGLQQRTDSEEEGAPYVPDVYHLSGRIISITTTAFVFLSAFALNTFWSATKAADAAVQSETRSYYSALLAVGHVEDEASRTLAENALADYKLSVDTVEGPMMQQADVAGAYQAHLDALLKVSDAVAAAAAQDPATSPAWDRASDDIIDMASYGEERVRALPGEGAPSIIWLLITLGLVNLAMLTAFQPTFFRRNLFLVAVAGLITALLMFMVVEVSNPYVGAGSVKSSLADVEIH